MATACNDKKDIFTGHPTFISLFRSVQNIIILTKNIDPFNKSLAFKYSTLIVPDEGKSINTRRTHVI